MSSKNQGKEKGEKKEERETDLSLKRKNDDAIGMRDKRKKQFKKDY